MTNTYLHHRALPWCQQPFHTPQNKCICKKEILKIIWPNCKFCCVRSYFVCSLVPRLFVSLKKRATERATERASKRATLLKVLFGSPNISDLQLNCVWLAHKHVAQLTRSTSRRSLISSSLHSKDSRKDEKGLQTRRPRLACLKLGYVSINYAAWMPTKTTEAHKHIFLVTRYKYIYIKSLQLLKAF